jgi:ubiquinone/menaquinone biosynthesis C-methylase UbiE
MADDRRLGEVRATYDRIAGHFATKRQNPWPEVESFLEGREGYRGLDLGCANGRHLELLAERCDRTVGLDVSRSLLAAARERLAGAPVPVALVEGDAAALPFADDTVNLAVYVATLHHLGTRQQRRRSLDELARVLSPDGQAIVSAWSVAAGRFDPTEGFDTTVDWTLPDGETVDRFYHIYDREEFAADVGASGLVADEVFVSSGNCYAHCRT